MAEPPAADLLASGDEREPGELWRRVPRRTRAALVALVVLAGALVVLVTGVGRPEPVPPPPLGTLGPAAARVDDSGMLVRVEAELRTREPVVLRSGTITGTDLVLLPDPVLSPAAGAPDAVTSQIVGLVEPACPDPTSRDRSSGAVLEVVIAPQAGGEALTLRSDVPGPALASAREAACAPVRASVALPTGSGPAAEQLEVTVRVPDATVPVRVVSLTGRGFRVDAADLADQILAASRLGRPFELTATGQVVVIDCSVEVLAPRRLVLEAQRGDDLLRVPVEVDRAAVAGLDELVRRTCRRPRI